MTYILHFNIYLNKFRLPQISVSVPELQSLRNKYFYSPTKVFPRSVKAAKQQKATTNNRFKFTKAYQQSKLNQNYQP